MALVGTLPAMRSTSLLRLAICLLPAAALLPEVPPHATDPSCSAPASDDPDSAATCGKCHTEIHAEWKGRAHANAWTDEVFQTALKDKKRPEVCYPCHIPTSVLDKLGGKPATRDDLRAEGVTCVSCHKKEQAMHGPFGAKTDAHPTEKNPAFTEAGSTALCASCHSTKIGPVLPLAKDFEASGLDKHGKSCVGCHMPVVSRHSAVSMVTGKPVGEMREGRRHEILGPSDPEFCAKAFAFKASADGKDLVLAIENRAGHRIPGLTLRKFVVVTTALDGQGKALAEQREEISSERELSAVETRQVRIPVAGEVDRVRVEVEHWFEDKKVATLKSVTVEVE